MLGAAGIAMVWSAASGATPGWFFLAGAAVVAVPLWTIVSMLRSARASYLTFGRDTFRVENRLPKTRCDREFRWDEVTDLALEGYTSPQTSAPLPIITFSHPTDSVVTRTSPSEAREVLATSEGRWRLWVTWFSVEPNALLATMRYLSAAPEHRTDMTVATLTAMLTPPGKSEH